mmetsp:Transcript_60779/g.144797  ORF Transcript_60779/g.144797 Transcript_60779/m.144797 type:complete len:162 (+) Transcript_60779:189-674(+)
MAAVPITTVRTVPGLEGGQAVSKDAAEAIDLLKQLAAVRQQQTRSIQIPVQGVGAPMVASDEASPEVRQALHSLITLLSQRTGQPQVVDKFVEVPEIRTVPVPMPPPVRQPPVMMTVPPPQPVVPIASMYVPKTEKKQPVRTVAVDSDDESDDGRRCFACC